MWVFVRFTHGWNYRQALADYVQLAGRIAMVPRYTMGTWWTRWSNLNNFDVLKLVRLISYFIFMFEFIDVHGSSLTGRI